MTATAELTALAFRVREAPFKVVAAAGARVQEEALTNARAAAGGDLMLTGKKRRGIPLEVTMSDVSEPGGARVHLAGKPAGVWRWIETGTKPHTIHRRRKGNLSKPSVAVHHPGTSGKHAWTVTKEAAPELIRAAGLAAVIAEVLPR